MRILVVVHGHPDIYAGGSEIVARSLSAAYRATPGVSSRFIAVLRPGDGGFGAGTGFASFDGTEGESLFVAGDLDDFFVSQNALPDLTQTFGAFLKTYDPHVVHFHHILNVGVEALRVTRNVLPEAVIAYTLHEFIPICNRQGQMLRTDDTLCTKAGPRRCTRCFPNIAASEFLLRERYIKANLQAVDGFIAPSRFVIQRYVDWGIDERKLTYIENGHPATGGPELEPRPPNPSRVFSFFGQINPYKGVTTLLEAVEVLLNGGVTDFVVRIHGTAKRQTKDFIETYESTVARVRAHPRFAGHVQLMGAYDPTETIGLMQEADAIVVPSRWWENSPLVIQEAFIAKRPVICSNIGGMAEKVRNEIDGLHFRARDPVSLARTMRRCIEEPGLLPSLNDFRAIPSTAESARIHLDHYSTLATTAASRRRLSDIVVPV